MKIVKNSVVSIHYTLKDDNGQLLDTSDGKAPLDYIQGAGAIIPGLETELEGKTKGDKINVTIAPENAYGQRNDQMVQTVPKTEFQDSANIVVGMQFEASTDQGPIIFTVIEIKDDEVIIDGNHPLAGLTLNFDVEVCAVRDATAEELSHGHVHVAGETVH